MKKVLFTAIILLVCIACKVNEPICTDCPSNNPPSSGSSGSSSSSGCGSGKTLYKGTQGGCYYINSNGNKVYVDRSCCN